jgi:L-fuculose-phosphate aldolase
MVGYEDLTLGHVSARGSDDRTIYIKRKGVALGEVTPADVLAVDLAEEGVGGNGMHLETVLHTEVYKRRPEVRGIVHGHPMYATAFGATDAEFSFLTHDSVMFVKGISTYDGVPDLIMDQRQGAQVAEALGDGTALLLRNHGVLVAERDVRWAVLASALLERAVQMQLLATSFGPLHPIPAPLLEGIHATKYQDDFAGEYWDAWIRELRRRGRAFEMSGES